MAVRKVKGTTVYPHPTVRSRIETIASSDPDGASFNYYANKFMRWGLKKYERMQARKAGKGQLQKA